MHPVLLEWGPFHLYSYGALVCLGGVLSCRFLYGRRARMGLAAEDRFWHLVNAMLFGGFIGGRLLHIVEYVPLAAPDFWSQALAFNRGFSILGAFGGVAAGVYLCCRHLKVPYLPVIDYVCQVAPLWHFFGRLGCLAAGCCYGKPAPPGAFLPIVFTDPRSLTPPEMRGLPLYPAQLYDSFGELGIAALLFFLVLPRLERGRLRPGTLFAAYFMAYGLLRFATEFFRGDTVALPGTSLTGGQVLALGLAASSLAVLAVVYNRRDASHPL